MAAHTCDVLFPETDSQICMRKSVNARHDTCRDVKSGNPQEGAQVTSEIWVLATGANLVQARAPP